MKRQLILVSAIALINDQEQLLVAQRPEGKSMAGLWEFPGGKLEQGESPEAALVRECHEELAITVAEQDLTPLCFASHAYEKFHLMMPLFSCRSWQGEPKGAEGQSVKWVNAAQLQQLPMPPADAPLLKALSLLLV